MELWYITRYCYKTPEVSGSSQSTHVVTFFDTDMTSIDVGSLLVGSIRRHKVEIGHGKCLLPTILISGYLSVMVDERIVSS